MSETAPRSAFFDVRPHERRIAAAMCTYFFLVITSFWILKPLKKTLFIGYYARSSFDAFGKSFTASEAELLAKVMNMVVAAGAAVVFSLLARRLRRDRLTSVFTLFFIVAYGLFALVLERPSALAVWSFYLFGDLFSTLMVAAFFSFLNDSVSSDGAKRLYGLVGFGGVAGGVFGSTAVSAWIDWLSLGEWLGVTAGLGLLILAVARGAAQELARSPEAREPTATRPAPPDEAPALAGVGLVFRSDYLLSIVAIVGLYEIVSTLVDFQFTTSIVEFSANEAERNRAFARVYATTNWLSMFVQLFLTSFVMRRFGLQTALLVLPCAIALSSIAFVARPSLVLGGALSVSDNAFSYSINQSSKEALYVPTTVAEKYQAKAFIDMFVQRFAKALGVGLGLIASSHFGGAEGVRKLSFVVLPALALWAFAAAHAGRRFAALEAERAGSEPRHD
jgi:AAA family ATP:ADP antiporter